MVLDKTSKRSRIAERLAAKKAKLQQAKEQGSDDLSALESAVEDEVMLLALADTSSTGANDFELTMKKKKQDSERLKDRLRRRRQRIEEKVASGGKSELGLL